MIVLIVFCAIVWWLNWCASPNFAQSLCLEHAPPSHFQEFYRAIVCGGPLTSPLIKQTFVNCGLIHILVVSGSHLMFLDQLVERLNMSRRSTLLWVHVPFAILAGLQPPVIRAVLQRGFLHYISWRLTTLQVHAVVTAIVLVIVPSWYRSHSFLLSWMCGLLLSTPRFTKWPQGLETAVKVFLGLLPFSVSIGIISPVSILTNWLIAPLIGCLLFPCSLFCFLIPWLTPVVDVLWLVTTKFLASLPVSPPEPVALVGSNKLFLVPLIFQTLLLYLEVHWQRKSLYWH